MLAAAIAAASPAAADPTVLRFAPGATTLRTEGWMASPSVYEHSYSLEMRKGQTLTMNFEGDGPLVGTIQCGDDMEGPLSGYGDSYVVPRSGPCILTIGIGRMAERWTGSYRLAVTAK